MRLGAILGPIADAANPRALADQAHALEAEGYASLWSVQAIGRGFMITDPWIALAVAATSTRAVELGTAVVQLPLYQPLDLAHRVLSLRQVCGPRLILGVGAGSTVQDFQAFGRDYDGRFTTFHEHLRVLREVLVSGAHGGVALSPWAEVLAPIPLFLGSWGNGVVRAARQFDGWIASANYRTADEVIAALGRYRAAGGRRAVVSTIQVPARADLAALGDKLQRFAAAGFDDAVVLFQPGAPSAAAVRRLLD